MKILESLFRVSGVQESGKKSHPWAVALTLNGGESELDLFVDEESGRKLISKIGQDVKVTITVEE